MDPKECLRMCDQAISDGCLDSAREMLADYREWRAKGGYVPLEVAGTFMNGDVFAEWCERRINDYR